MLIATTSVKTDHAAKYLQQLCKHFAHKVDVEYDAVTGKAAFPSGACHMTADEEGLHVRCEADTEDALMMSKVIFEKHIVRFAWREEIELDWTSS